MRPPRFLPVLFLLLSCLMALTACTPPSSRNPFAYAESAFSLSVEGVYLPANDQDGTPRPFAAAVTVGAPQGGDLTERGLSVTFTVPESLAGVTVTATLSPAPDGSISRRVEFAYPSDYGTIQATAEGDELDGFLRFAQGWLPVGDVAEVSPKNADGSYTVTRKSGDREAVFTFGAGETFPTGVKLTDKRGTVEMSVQ
ncbi:MAG: hypothetical protein IKM33_00335 [Clostridia bacterium]|nr:hypothetical protein [Clostridia bacterium]